MNKKPLASIDELRAAFVYDPDTGVVSHRQDRFPGLKAGERAGYRSGNGYWYVSYDNKNYIGHRLAWALYFGEWPSQHIDHINMSRTDNRLCNLRAASPSENLFNKPVRKDSKSGIKGVHQCPHGRWWAKIKRHGVIHHLGYFDTSEEASAAYKEAAERLHGEFARVA